MIAYAIGNATCWECQTELADSFKFCPECGLSQVDRHSRPLYVVDATTGLSNEGFLRGLLDYELLRAIRHGRALSTLVVDVRPDPVHGQPGDYDGVLCQLADTVKGQIRETDTAGLLGCDAEAKLAVILPETNASGAAVVAEKLTAAIQAHRFLGYPSLRVNVRIGTATYEAGCPRPPDLLEAANSQVGPWA